MLNLRPFQNEDDYKHLAAILTASENADQLALTITPEYLAERLNNTPHFDLTRDLMIAEVDGQAVGYGRVRWAEENGQRSFSLTGFLLPEWRRKGIGLALLNWQESRARAMARALALELPAADSNNMTINTTQYQVGLQALALKAGYTIKESWALMVRPNLDDIPDVPLPAGLEVRPALPEHFPAIWFAVEEAYVPEGGPAPTGVIPEDFKNDPNFQPELWQVAWDIRTNRVAGSVMTYVSQAENEQLGIRRGYTEGISTTPAWQRQGVAQALISLSLKVQRDLGLQESAMVVNVAKPNNYRLYVSCGFQEVKRDSVYQKSIAK